MAQESIEFKKNHTEFVQTICATQKVYAIKNEEGYATSFSLEMEDENEEPVEVFCFWSSNEKAALLLKDEWKDFDIDTIDLATFLENWCVGMNNEGLLIGTDFDETLNGFEIDPLELMLEISSELKAKNQTITLCKFKDINDMETQVKAILEGE